MLGMQRQREEREAGQGTTRPTGGWPQAGSAGLSGAARDGPRGRRGPQPTLRPRNSHP